MLEAKKYDEGCLKMNFYKKSSYVYEIYMKSINKKYDRQKLFLAEVRFMICVKLK